MANDRRALIEQKKAEARQRAELARREAETIRFRAKHPAPKYVDMPEHTGDPEADDDSALNELQAGFRKRAKDEERRFFLATDSEYWACLCFQTREQKEAFLSALNILKFGDKYLDGTLVAKELGVTLPSADVPYNTSAKVDRKLMEFVNSKRRK